MISGSGAAILFGTYWAALGLVLVWNTVAAGQAARVRQAPPWLARITAVCGLLIPVAVFVAVFAPHALAGRTLHVIYWLWPLTAVLSAIQSLATLARIDGQRWIVVPIAVYGVLAALIAVLRWLVGMGAEPGTGAFVLLASQSQALSPLLGPAALERSFGILVPVLAPLYPARWILGRIARPLVATGTAAIAALLLLVALPRAARAVDGFRDFISAVPALRGEPELLQGLRVFGPLVGPPPALAVRNDLALADSMDARILAIVVRPAATSIRALDSLERAVRTFRLDSTPRLLAITLDYDNRDGELLHTAPDSLLSARVAMTGRIVRTLRPDAVFPAPPRSAGRLHRTPSSDTAWLRRYLVAASEEVRHLRPRTLVGASVGRLDARDSALYEWAVASPAIDVTSFQLFPTLDGAAGLEAGINTVDRWISQRTAPHRHWVVAGGYPTVFGEENQRLTLRRIAAWASRTPAITAVIAADAGDYGTLTGLRAPGGRVR